jgi:hypothetical protein
LSTSITIGNIASSASSSSGSTNTDGSLAAVARVSIAVAVSSGAIGGSLADTGRASNTRSNVRESAALGTTGIAVVGISLEVERATILSLANRSANRESSVASQSSASGGNA